MGVNEYLIIVKKFLVKNRIVVKESKKYFKIYLPTKLNDIWSYIYINRMKVDVIVMLPYEVSGIDKILMLNRSISKENERYKLYLSREYNHIWSKLHKEGKVIDLIISLRS